MKAKDMGSFRKTFDEFEGSSLEKHRVYVFAVEDFQLNLILGLSGLN